MTTPDPPLPPRAALRWSVVRRLVHSINPHSILEIGCGMGAFGVRLARIAPYTAVEPDDTSFEVASPRIGAAGGTVLHGDHTTVTDDRFDLVCAFEVLEHLEDDATALREWMALVQPGGSLLLSVPADPERLGPFDAMVGHFRRYAADDLRRLLVEAGGEDVTLVHYAWPLGYALDAVRDRLASRSPDGMGETAEQRTAGSGRVLQPRARVLGWGVRVGVAPFVALQRLRPGTGPALVALARKPAAR